MSAEDFALVREALEQAHARMCGDGHAWRECEDIRASLSALARLEARLAEVENDKQAALGAWSAAEARVVELTADRAEFAGDWRLAVERAEAAEARLAEVERERDEAGMLPEEGLERIASLACDLLAALRPWEMHGPTVRSSAARLTIALAALPLQAAPKQDEAEGEK